MPVGGVGTPTMLGCQRTRYGHAALMTPHPTPLKGGELRAPASGGRIIEGRMPSFQGRRVFVRARLQV